MAELSVGTELIGRTEQLAVLDAAVGRAQAGEPQFVVLGGEAGVGKTRLMGHVAATLEEVGARVLRGGCVELGAEGLPLAPVTAALRDLVRQTGADTLTGDPAAAGLARLLPELAVHPRGPASHAELLEQFAVLLARLGTERLVVLAVDDLHWADRSTRELLGYLARSLRATRVLVVTAYRSDDLDRGHPLRPFLAELERLPSVRRVEVPRLSRAETVELVASVVGRTADAALADAVFRRSAGNALFAEELARAQAAGGAETLPDSLRNLLLARVERLGEPTRHVLAVAAVGDQVPHRLLEATAGIPADALLTALRAATGARVLIADGDAYTFRHPLLREVVIDDLLPAERVRLHRAYAEALEARPDLVAPERLAAALAFHWHGAREPSRALPAALRAADAAAALYAHAEQFQMLQRALELWPQVPDAPRVTGTDRHALWEQALAAGGWAGENVALLDLLDRALAETDQAGQPERAAMLLAHRGRVLHILGRDGAVTALEEAARLAPGLPTAARARVLNLVSAILMAHGYPDRARPAAAEALRAAEAHGDQELAVNARTTLGTSLARLGDRDRGLALLEEARAQAQREHDAVRLTRVQLNLAITQATLGRHQATLDIARAGLDAARTAGLMRNLGALLAARLASSLFALGRWHEADLAATEALQLDPPGPYGALLHAIRGELALAGGGLDAARQAYALAGALLGTPAQIPYQTLPVVRLGALLALQDGRLRNACAAVAGGLPLAALPGAAVEAWPLLLTGARVEAHARLRARTIPGEDTDASLAGELRAAAAALPVDTPLWAACAAQFTAELDPDPQWAAVAAAWDGIGEPYAAATARLRAGETAARAGDRAAVQGWLREAAEQAKRLGAWPLLEEVELLARTANVTLAGPTAPPADASDLERLGLTDREAEVLRLVTAGRSNRQIAEELFISPKTASVHVSRILAKLGAATRGEAAATAHRLRLFS